LSVPIRAMLCSFLLPGGGHWLLGLRWRAASLFVTFAAALWFATAAARGQIGDAPQIFFEATWIGLSVWLFAMVDAYQSASEPAWVRYNPRLAALLNLTTRGLGYFYLDRPWIGAPMLIALGGLPRLANHLGMPGLTAMVPVIEVITALHAYHLARGERAAEPLRLATALAPVAVLITAAVVGMLAVSAGHSALAASAVSMPRTEAVERRVAIPEIGLSLCLPNATWRVETDARTTMVKVESPQARLLLFRSQGPAGLGLEGYLVSLAGQLVTQYGPVNLTGQKDLEADGPKIREVCYEWSEARFRASSHVFLVPQGDEVKVFLVASPSRLEGRARVEVEQLLTSIRLTQ